MYRPRAARSEPNDAASMEETSHSGAQPADKHPWRVRTGALCLLAVAVIIPVAASAAAQPVVKGRASTPATKVSVQTSALAKRIPKPKVVHHAKAKPATPVTTTPPRPVITAPPTTRYIPPPTTRYIPPPTTRYIPPTTQYIPPTTRYIPPTTRYVAPTTRYIPPATAAAPQVISGRCGGSLPPCYVMMRESRGSLTAHNPTSTASGKWQFLNSTWNGYGGYSSAASAPESVQDARAAQVWAGGAGCSNWSACG